MDYVIVGIGGVCGSILRFLVSRAMAEKTGTTWPAGTWAVNISGTFFLSLVMGLATRGGLMGREVGLALTTGVLGAYTTFSALSYETIRLMQDGARFRALGYVLSSVVFGLAAAWLGVWISQQ